MQKLEKNHDCTIIILFLKDEFLCNDFNDFKKDAKLSCVSFLNKKVEKMQEAALRFLGKIIGFFINFYQNLFFR